MSEKLEKESIDGGREGGREGGTGQAGAKWLVLHLQRTKQSKCESAFLPLSFFMFFLSDGRNGTERREARKEQGRKLSARMYLARQHFSSQVR